MFALSKRTLASFIVISAAFCMPSYADEGFKTSDFLQWPEESRSSYVQNALMMANLIAVENDKRQADCIGGWYFSDQQENDAYIAEIMAKYPKHHPMGVLLAIIEKKCGSFKY